MNRQQKYLFIDRDGTLIREPADKQVDSIAKLQFMPGVFLALSELQQRGFKLIMVTNQDGLGTKSFPEEDFRVPHELMLEIFKSQAIKFANILICPHFEAQNCDCRKPKVGLLLDYLKKQTIDRENSYVIGDRHTDLLLAQNLGIKGYQIADNDDDGWKAISHNIINKPRTANVTRNTTETEITVQIDLDQANTMSVDTGIGFFNHMLEQLIKHAGISATVKVAGDLHIDEHHTVEDTALALGFAIKNALGDKHGIARYGFTLPMDEAAATVVLDLSGRSHWQFTGNLVREKVGELATEMVIHFFRSLAEGMQATVHMKVEGDNAHHMVEAMFKVMGRALRQAIAKQSTDLPSTKGIL